jgi:hypothetical protein
MVGCSEVEQRAALPMANIEFNHSSAFVTCAPDWVLAAVHCNSTTLPE